MRNAGGDLLLSSFLRPENATAFFIVLACALVGATVAFGLAWGAVRLVWW